MDKCLCGCGEPVDCRGLSKACYQRACKAVAARKTTWTQLKEQGLALGRKKPGAAIKAAWYKNKRLGVQ